jgi:hypothetical protein
MADMKTKLNVATLFHEYIEGHEKLLPHAEQEIEELCKEVTDCCEEEAETVCKPMPAFFECLAACMSLAVAFMFVST